MKHAILIIAHNNFPQLIRLINKLDDNCQVYLHLDRKMALSEQECDILSSLSVVKGIYSRYKINWGGFNMLKTALFLLKEAANDKENSYFHLLSGQDYPVKPVADFTKFVEENNGKEFLEYHTLPYGGWDNGTYRRYEFFFFHDLFNYRTGKGYRWILKTLRFQMKWNIKRQIPHHFETIYGGCCWFTLSRACICYLLEYTRRQPAFYRRLKYTFVPEETYFHSVILNSQFKEKVVNRSLRYVDWRYRNGNIPANLDESDFEALCMNDAFFARKFKEDISDKLISLIDERLNKRLIHS
jgi:hypothetical protein